MSEEKIIPARPTLWLEAPKKVGPLAKKEISDAWAYKKENKPVAWVFLGGTMEINRAFDIALTFPENYNTAIAAAGSATPCIEVTVNAGWPRWMCSYFTINWGFAAEARLRSDLKFPGGGIPMPDILVGDGISCLHRIGWWRAIQELTKAPTFILEVPLLSQRMTRDKIDDHVIEYEVAQFQELISFLEQQTGQKFDEEKLKEVMNLSDEATRLAWEITNLQTTTIPCPSGLEDAVYMLYPLDCLIGTKEAVDFFKVAKEELEAKVAKGESALPEEKYRLLFMGNLPYYALGVLSYPHKYGAIFVGDPLLNLVFSNPMIPLELDRPLETLARKYISYYLNLSFNKHVEWQDYFLRGSQIDGILYMVQRGCKIASGAMAHLRNIAEERYGLPTLYMEMEQADPGDYNPVRVALQLDSFMEVVAARKEERKRGRN